jgi:hypothetical protein
VRSLDSATTLIELGAGGALLVCALGWATLSRRRRAAKRVLRRALADPDGAVRRAAVVLAGDGGVSKNAAMLLALARHETDPAVRDALAETVARNLWEPASERRVVELRLWARQHLDARPSPANGTTHGGGLAREILARDGYRCTYVGDGGRCTFTDRTGAELEVHIPPLSARRNGSAADAAVAAQTLCRRHLLKVHAEVRLRQRLLRPETR